MIYLLLFVEFFKAGLFAIGGGLATLPFLYDIADRHPDWFTRPLLADMIAISESTPGPIGINMAVYAGFQTAGFLGSFCAVFGLVLPSLVIIVLIAKFFQNFNKNLFFKSAFEGIRPASVALIALATWKLLEGILFLPQANPIAQGFSFFEIIQWKALLPFGFICCLLFWKKLENLHPITFIAIGALIGIIFQF